MPPDATVYEAIDQMAQKGVGALLVMEGEQLVGIVSERGYARKVILKGKPSRFLTSAPCRPRRGTRRRHRRF